MGVVIDDLAIEAVEALGHVDFARRFDGLDRAVTFAQMAGIAAFGAVPFVSSPHKADLRRKNMRRIDNLEVLRIGNGYIR